MAQENSGKIACTEFQDFVLTHEITLAESIHTPWYANNWRTGKMVVKSCRFER